MSGSVKLVIAGLGLVGKRHAAAIKQVAGVNLVAVVDPSDEGKADAAEIGVPCYHDLQTMFAEMTPDGVVLATPTPLHVEQGLECVAHGCATLVEKPIAVTAAEASRLVSAAKRANVPLLVGHHRRHNPIVQEAQKLINDGKIGQVRALHSTCWFYKPDHYFDVAPWRKKKGAGPISVNLVHDVDLIRSFCGEVVSVQAQATPSMRGFENEDLAAALLTFESDAIGTIAVSDTIASPWSWELTSNEYPIYPPTAESCYQIGGTLGSLSVPDLRLWTHAGEPDWWNPISATTMLRKNSDPLLNQIEHFKAVICDGEAPLVSGEEGLKTLEVIEAIQRAAETKQTVFVNASGTNERIA